MLAERLPSFDRASTVVITPPRGGLPVAREIALAFSLPFDVVLVRRVAVPGREDVALGVVSDGRELRLSFTRDSIERLGLDAERRAALTHRTLSELGRRYKTYVADHPPVRVTGKTAVVVDDGAVTGATLRAVLHVLREQAVRRVVLALPIAPAHVLAEFERLVDDIVCLDTPFHFDGVGVHYAAFDPVSDLDVRLILAEMHGRADLGEEPATLPRALRR
ncbi:hypothetical protein AWJ14_03400 [Hoeflea olei]|uniref:Phosphoribosyltransferase domain-containing protein n=2 Tax=Hoeflea olei TaxID=1480615 RepID=A0A1C1YWJ6_9HYPH|nr:hypothetical protein AWJ14_03400 [Hoeflea olei]